MIPELVPYFNEHFAPALQAVFFRGYFTTISTWVSASGNVYPRHNDVGDGILVQIYGRKIITLFDVPPDYYTQTIFDHSFGSQPDPYPLPSRECYLEPGQALFIPREMPHEVRIPDGEQSVAVSFRARGIYSLLDLCEGINTLAGNGTAFRLSPSDSRREKPLVKYFDPHSSLVTGCERDQIPERLKETLLGVLRTDSKAFKRILPRLLDQWWSELELRHNQDRESKIRDAAAAQFVTSSRGFIAGSQL